MREEPWHSATPSALHGTARKALHVEAVTAAQADFHQLKSRSLGEKEHPEGKPPGQPPSSPGQAGGSAGRARSPSAQAFPAGPAPRLRGAAGERQPPAPPPQDAEVAPDIPPRLACLGRGGAPAPAAQRGGRRGLPGPLRPPQGSAAVGPAPEGRGSALGQPSRRAGSSRRAEAAAPGRRTHPQPGPGSSWRAGGGSERRPCPSPPRSHRPPAAQPAPHTDQPRPRNNTASYWPASRSPRLPQQARFVLVTEREGAGLGGGPSHLRAAAAGRGPYSWCCCWCWCCCCCWGGCECLAGAGAERAGAVAAGGKLRGFS